MIEEDPPEKSLMRTNDSDDPMFHNTSDGVSSEFYIKNSFKTAGWNDLASWNIPIRLSSLPISMK